MKNIKIKLNKNSKINYGKILFSEKTIFTVIKNLISGNNKKEILNYILYDICLCKDINLNNIKENKNSINNENNINNNEINNIYYFCKSSKLLYIILAVLFENKEEESMLLFYDFLEKIINFSEINIKSLLNFDIISIMVKSLLHIENQELIHKTKNILLIILKYLDGKSLINYTLIIYLFLYDILINESNNNKKKELSIELLNFLKKGLSSAKMINYNYLSVSNAAINNPYIYNLFYITGLNKTSQIINYSINIRILNNSEINDFNLATFINRTSSLILSFVLNKNELIITEIINKKEKKIFF
jgi:hypothetical protein